MTPTTTYDSYYYCYYYCYYYYCYYYYYCVLLEWKDRSLCEEGFSFYRKGEGQQQIVFTDDYNYASSERCNAVHRPEFVKEKLKVAKLPVGSDQTYCIMAFAPSAGDAYHSAPTCKSVTIEWEAVLSGKVELPPLSGLTNPYANKTPSTHQQTVVTTIVTSMVTAQHSNNTVTTQ